MVLIEKVGNIKAYAEKNVENDYTVYLINGVDIIAQEIYFINNAKKAVEDFLLKRLDICTEEWLYINVPDLEKLTDNTYKSGEKDYFCRINGTRFFQHYCKNAEDFIRDKNGKRIIDKQEELNNERNEH